MRYAFFRYTTYRLRICAVLTVVLCTAFVMPAIFAAAAESPPTVNIDIAKFAYGPKETTIAPGTKVIWTNRDETPHTVTSNDKSFASKGLDTDDKFEHTFSNEGDFSYICTVHPFMTGVLHVRKQ
ncbi:MAG TPA: cupredoxin family copper-binding protein [Casimicrobiaceae bacterium]|jgi:plastocyanin